MIKIWSLRWNLTPLLSPTKAWRECPTFFIQKCKSSKYSEAELTSWPFALKCRFGLMSMQFFKNPSYKSTSLWPPNGQTTSHHTLPVIWKEKGRGGQGGLETGGWHSFLGRGNLQTFPKASAGSFDFNEKVNKAYLVLCQIRRLHTPIHTHTHLRKIHCSAEFGF